MPALPIKSPFWTPSRTSSRAASWRCLWRCAWSLHGHRPRLPPLGVHGARHAGAWPEVL